MHRALRLAGRAAGRTSPNPMVGAVIVRRGRIVGAGYHRQAGLAHAEVEALRQAGRRARGATMYVTLEPCNHQGRTPPCCEAILAAGISRVVAATRDPNPITKGRGFTRLRRSGIRVTSGVLERESQTLNEPFEKVMRTGVPWMLAKMGQSLDGKIATRAGQSRWITSDAARRTGREWRGRVDAILTGVNTIRRDDPLLTARTGSPRAGKPVKIIVDSRLRMPLAARCLSPKSPAPTLIATTVHPSAGRRRALLRRGAEVIVLPSRRGRVPLRQLAKTLARRGIHSVLIEGGGEVLSGALEERLVDRVAFFIAPVLIGGRSAPGSVGGLGISRLSQAVQLRDVSITTAGSDLQVEARVVYPG